MKFVIFLTVVLLQVGCAFIQKDKHIQHSLGSVLAETLALSDQQRQLCEFVADTPSPTEIQKIHYLLSRIRTSDVDFIRNGQSYTGKQASKWLLWKMRHKQYRKDPIRTVHDFVTRVADKSKKTGLPYKIKFENGKKANVQKILLSELEVLEQALRNRQVDEQLEHVSEKVSEEIKEIPASTTAPNTPVVVSAAF